MDLPSRHAKLSASGASKWIASPPSLWLEEGLPDTTSPYAEEGTLAHSIVEAKLKLQTGLLSPDHYESLINKYVKQVDYSPSMNDYTDEHVELVIEDYNGTPNADLLSEQEVNFSKWAPGGFGTSDSLIMSPGLLQIWDLKYGKGVKVRADHNVQLMLYALGAIDEFGFVYDFKEVEMTISQPRLGHVDTFKMSVDDLLEWGETVVKPAADDALNGEGTWNFDEPGSWRFFKAAGFCEALAQKNLEIRKYNFKEANTLKPAEIADILAQKDRITKWLDAIEYYATTQVRDHGMKLPGWKLVAGRANRKINDEAKAAELLENAGFDARDIYKAPQLQTIGQLEKLTGKKNFSEVLGDVVVRPDGKPTLVIEDDKRPALGSVASAQKDFE